MAGPWAAQLLADMGADVVKVEAPDKPIVINLNVKIEQEVRVRVEKDWQRKDELLDRLGF